MVSRRETIKGFALAWFFSTKILINNFFVPMAKVKKIVFFVYVV